MATFHILNFGCRASQADGAALKQQLLEAGLTEAPTLDESVVAVLNTCTVTATADAEVRQFVRRIHRRNPHCRILVTGCYAQRAPEEIARLEGVTWVVGNSHKHLIGTVISGDRVVGRSGEQNPGSRGWGLGVGDLIGPSGRGAIASPCQAEQNQLAPAGSQRQPDSSLVQIRDASSELRVTTNEAGFRSPDHPIIGSTDSAFGSMTRWPEEPIVSPAPGTQSPPPVILVGPIAEEFHFAPAFADDRTRPTLKIQDGCDARCSFCVIPAVRGQSRSMAPDLVVEQVRQLADAGYHELVLSGINLGGYGRDLGRRINLLGIIERLLRETSIARLRISSIEPMDVTPPLIRLVAQEPRMAQHFHVPLQSGCDRILRMMNRRYWTTQYADRVLAIREQIPNAALGADVMVGFPGETDEDHAASLRFMESLPYTYLHIFPFSARPGTPAVAAAGPVNGRVARERSTEIRKLISAKRGGFLSAQLGRRLAALTLDQQQEGARIALTTNYLKVALPAEEFPPNRLVDVFIGRVAADTLIGHRRQESSSVYLPCPL